MENNIDKNEISPDEGDMTSSNSRYLLHPWYRGIARKGMKTLWEYGNPKGWLGIYSLLKFTPYLKVLVESKKLH